MKIISFSSVNGPFLWCPPPRNICGMFLLSLFVWHSEVLYARQSCELFNRSKLFIDADFKTQSVLTVDLFQLLLNLGCLICFFLWVAVSYFPGPIAACFYCIWLFYHLLVLYNGMFLFVDYLRKFFDVAGCKYISDQFNQHMLLCGHP